MLTPPTHGGSLYRVMGIDPGTDTLGVGLVSIDLETQAITLTDGLTFTAHQQLVHSESLIEVLGYRHTRLLKLSEALKRCIGHIQPHAIICEAPYLGRFPQAYGALVECLAMIRSVVFAYDPGLMLHTIDPASAKAALGVSGQSQQKLDVREALVNHPRLQPHVDFNQLDEHAFDALLVACYHVQSLGFSFIEAR